MLTLISRQRQRSFVRTLQNEIAAIEALLSHDSTDLSGFQNTFVKVARECLGVDLVSLWAHDPVHRWLVHSASSGPAAFDYELFLDVSCALFRRSNR